MQLTLFLSEAAQLSFSISKGKSGLLSGSKGAEEMASKKKEGKEAGREGRKASGEEKLEELTFFAAWVVQIYGR